MTNRKFHYQAIVSIAIFLVSVGSAGLSEARNPFKYGEKATNHFKEKDSLEAILILGDKKIAIIGGKEYSLDDNVGEFTIVTININYVALISSKKKRKLYLNDQL